MNEPGSNEELFSLIIVSDLLKRVRRSNMTLSDNLFPFWSNFDYFGSGFNDGLGRQDAEGVCLLVHQAPGDGPD